jgi:TatD DNase family protein
MKGLPGDLVDAHAHLDRIEGVEEHIERAGTLGVRAIVGVSMGLASMETTLRVSRTFPQRVLPAVGLHPWQIEREDVNRALQKVESSVEQAVAVGEIGLDYGIKTKKAWQKEIFQRQLDLAKQSNLPVILHCRYSHHRVLRMVVETGIERAVFHWYTGPLELIEGIVEQGYFVSATPALGYSRKHQEAVLSMPLEHILLETDCPVSYQGKPAKPADVIQVCAKVASLKGTCAGEVARTTTSNVRRFLGLAPFAP